MEHKIAQETGDGKGKWILVSKFLFIFEILKFYKDQSNYKFKIEKDLNLPKDHFSPSVQ